MIRVQYRDDGFWTQVWHVCWYLWKRGRLKTFPDRGFVGRVSSLSAVSDPGLYKTTSIQMRRIHSTLDAPLWRLTYASETFPLPSAHGSNGPILGESGKPSAVVGEEIFSSPTTTTSMFPVSRDDN